MLLTVILYTTIAGVLGTCIGGLLCIFIKKPSNKFIGNLFYFAGGVMLGISFLHLINESMHLASVGFVMIGLVLGVLLVYLVERYLSHDKILSKKPHVINLHSEDCKKSQDENEICDDDCIQKRQLKLTSFILFVAISLHNLPEGLAIGASSRLSFGLATAIAIGVHNIPEGMAIGLPMKMAKSKASTILKYCFLTGVPTVFGGIIGYLIGTINNVFLSLCLSMAAGSMIFVTFLEMIPKAHELSDSKFTLTSATSLFSGIFVALLLLLL